MYKRGTLLELPYPAGDPQFAINYGHTPHTCEAANYSAGRQWGSQVVPGFPKHKFHARLSTTAGAAVGADAHLERKIHTGGCAEDPPWFNDAVYRKYNGMSGFDAAMMKIASAYRLHSSSTVTTVVSASPFTHQFKQCTGEIVQWSGKVAYITRPG